MKHLLSLLTFVLILNMSNAQTNQEIAHEKGREAIALMDSGEYDKSIEILKECEKLDPENYVYPYEIAFAHVLQENYSKALKILNKVKKFERLTSQVYQMSGNCQSYMGNPEKAIAEYEEGMKKFPNAGNLHLEKGNIYLFQKNYDEAIKNYENGIAVDPTFPSNYFRLAKLFLNSSDLLSGVIYGEIFMNLERTTARTQEISEMLYNTYASAIKFSENQIEVDFCKVVIAIDSPDEIDNFKLPLCAIFDKNMALAILSVSEINLTSLNKIRTEFINQYYQGDHKEYPNVLFEYHKKMLDLGYFDAYNHYVFQIGTPDEFNTWLSENEASYKAFVEWYTQSENVLQVTSDNRYIRQ